MHGAHSDSPLDLGLVLLAPLLLAVAAYLLAARVENAAGRRRWPTRRSACLVLGAAAVAAVLVGPLADRAHDDLSAHMAAHLLVGMVAPLLLVLSAPVTLALRTLPVVPARRLSRLLASMPARCLSHPVVAAALSVGSLWLLYATPLSALLEAGAIVHNALLLHFLIAGYLFAASMVGMDPAPHRAGYPLRLVVLLLSVAAHSMLAKTMFANPPPGAGPLEAAQAGMLMYYGGDAAELAIIAVFFRQWYLTAARSRGRSSTRTGSAAGARGSARLRRS